MYPVYVVELFLCCISASCLIFSKLFLLTVRKQSECCSEVAALSTPLETVLQDAARTAQHISVLQKQRQKDIWKIMEIAVSECDVISEMPVTYLGCDAVDLYTVYGILS